MTPPQDDPLWRLTATAARDAVRTGEVAVEAIVASHLNRIREREPTVKAWAYVDEAGALGQARALRATADRPLRGVTVGIKDVIDTADMPTEYNSDIYRGHRPGRDATCVARLRAAGAVILGKTETTEFAHAHPARTVNPHNIDHTPGGSSCGSAAATADHMVATALGTQTGGSTIRPAAFCGVFALKPTHGLIDVTGLKPLAWSLDTIGLFARSIADLELLLPVLAGHAIAASSQPVVSRVAVCRTENWNEATAPARQSLTNAVEASGRAGATVRDLTLPPEFDGLNDVHQTVMAYETAKAFAAEWATGRDKLSASFAAFLERGQGITEAQYADAAGRAADVRARFDPLVGDDEIVLTLSSTGEAPLGLSHTGNAVFNRMWTLLHVPAVHVPWGRGPNGLPLGVQLVAPRGRDRSLLAAAAWIHQCLSAATNNEN